MRLRGGSTSVPGHAHDRAIASPQAAVRTYAQNDQDMALTTCNRQRRSDKDAATDAGGSVSALRDWPLLQHGKSPDAIRSPVERYRLRNANPPADAEVKELRVDFRKYLDLYHGSELEAPARRIVIHPGLIYRHDSPSHAAPK
ncbi:hypothetical protein B7R77_22625 [Ralstonia solanacearum K60]|uniref:Uncharacterized protein n=2 Tax=Ralstonia solanacearum TaxID=305 RepID=A0AAP7ZIJ5_RALSL|nr:hypothetical protein B7R77_22625 [Ralstonia solanacearum K60]